MADTTYVPKTYRKDGGDTFVVASGGKILFETGGTMEIETELTITGDIILTGDLTLTLEDIWLKDNKYLQFGDATGGDVSMRWLSASPILQILPVADDTGAINIGDGTTDIDFKVFLGTSGKYVDFNVGDSNVVLSAGVSLSIDDITDTSSAVTGSIHTDGGIGIAKALWVGTTSRLVGAVTCDAAISCGTTLTMVGGDIDMATALTGTYDLILKAAQADALSIKFSSTDMMVFDTNTPKITITPATDITGVLTLAGGLAFSGASAAAIDLSGLTPQIGAGKFAIGLGKRGTAKSVTLTTDRYEPIQLVVTSHANPTGVQTMNLIYANIGTDVAQANSRLKVADCNVVVSNNLQDAYVYQGEIDFNAAGITVGGESAVMGLVMNAGADAVIGNLRGLIISMQGAGSYASVVGLEIRTTCGDVLGHGCSEAIRIAGTPLPVVGIAMGNQTTDNEGPQNAFFFPSIGGADEGPCVASGTATGAITIKIGAATKFIRFWETA